MTELNRQLDGLAGRLGGLGSVEIAGGLADSLLSASALANTLSAGSAAPAAGSLSPIGELDGALSDGRSRESEKEKDINITVPINVDGIQLGTAAIRGINAVTRATGRMLLDI